MAAAQGALDGDVFTQGAQERDITAGVSVKEECDEQLR
jgi:hypothetical protein